jgi:hypothetical protein
MARRASKKEITDHGQLAREDTSTPSKDSSSSSKPTKSEYAGGGEMPPAGVELSTISGMSEIGGVDQTRNVGDVSQASFMEQQQQQQPRRAAGTAASEVGDDT